jgi:hypothetical protein
LNIICQISAGLLHVDTKSVLDGLVKRICGLIAWCRYADFLTDASSEVLNRICFALESTDILPEFIDSTNGIARCVTESF